MVLLLFSESLGRAGISPSAAKCITKNRNEAEDMELTICVDAEVKKFNLF